MTPDSELRRDLRVLIKALGSAFDKGRDPLVVTALANTTAEVAGRWADTCDCPVAH